MPTRICIVLGPYDSNDLDYTVAHGYLVRDHFALYVTDSYLWLRKVQKAIDHTYLYIDDPNCSGLILAAGITQTNSSFILDIMDKLIQISALDFLITEFCNLVNGDVFLSVNETLI